jgi:hypothetical protein
MLPSYCGSKALLPCYHHTEAKIIGPKLLLSTEVASIEVGSDDDVTEEDGEEEGLGKYV